jgi:hypothetical protein
MSDFIAERQASNKVKKKLRLPHICQYNNARENKNINYGYDFYSRGHGLNGKWKMDNGKLNQLND